MKHWFFPVILLIILVWVVALIWLNRTSPKPTLPKPPEPAKTLEIVKAKQPKVAEPTVTRVLPPLPHQVNPFANSSAKPVKASSIKPPSSKKIVVDLSSQRLYLWQGGQLLMEAPICSGSARYTNVKGVSGNVYESRYVLTGYDADKVSSYTDIESRGIPMPYAVKMDNAPGNAKLREGLWIHGWHPSRGRFPSYPSSHGCINLPMDKAQQFFRLVKGNLDAGGKIPVEVVAGSQPDNP